MPKAILELPEMPESCLNCPCIAIDAWGKPKCRIIHSNNGLADAFSSGRRPDCPLKLVEGKDEQTNVKCRYCNSESVEIIARGTESILYKCRVCKMEFAKLNIKEGEP